MKTILSILFSLFFFISYAQKERNNWYFGYLAAINFDHNVPNVKYDHMDDAQEAPACISDPVTGKLILFCRHGVVLDANQNLMKNGTFNWRVNLTDAVIVPFPGRRNLYYIFYVHEAFVSFNIFRTNIYYALVDMNGNKGSGEVISSENLVWENFAHAGLSAMSAIAVVRNSFINGYWLIVHDSQTTDFLSFPITSEGVQPTPVRSDGSAYKTFIPLTTSSDGKWLAGSVSNSGSHSDYLTVCEIDKECGKVISSSQSMLLKNNFWSFGSGWIPSFSSNGRFLYTSYYDTLCNKNGLIQYDLKDHVQTPSYTIIRQSYRANKSYTDSIDTRSSQIGPDGKIYFNTNIDSLGTSLDWIDVINYPDKAGIACNYQYKAFTIGPGRNSGPRFPHFIDDTMPMVKEVIVKIEQVCLGDTSKLITQFIPLGYDSLRWDFDDSSSGKNNRSYAANTTHFFADSGTYKVVFHIYKCGVDYYKNVPVSIYKKPGVNLGSDTILCSGAVMFLNVANIGTRYLWSTGDTLSSINVTSKGKYKVTVSAGNCVVSDSININYYPNIWTALGDEYFICDREKELTKLDAGEGFTNYKWSPTGDTTQWIIVGDLGNYFVIVKDFNGCSGNDGTTVKRRCPVKVFFPNAFTPNNDGVNDQYVPVGNDVSDFSMTIYNRWGERVFETNSFSKTWDGSFHSKPAPADVYTFTANYSGYFNKRLTTFEAKGNITLIR